MIYITFVIITRGPLNHNNDPAGLMYAYKDEAPHMADVT